MKSVAFLVSLFFYSQSFAGSTFKIISGEYAPYSGEHLYKGGISTQVVQAVYKEMGKEIKLEFVPWKRAIYMLHNNPLTASYPWSKSPEREEEFIFSDPIHEFNIRYFVRKDAGLKSVKDFEAKKICRPSGWNNSYYEKTIKDKKMTLESPTNIESCLSMLRKGRVEIIGLDEVVGNSLLREDLKSGSVVSLEATDIPQKISFHFIMSKKSLFAKNTIESFNAGLRSIKTNGTYQRILQGITAENETKSTCGTCNRLGSL